MRYVTRNTDETTNAASMNARCTAMRFALMAAKPASRSTVAVALRAAFTIARVLGPSTEAAARCGTANKTTATARNTVSDSPAMTRRAVDDSAGIRVCVGMGGSANLL